MVEYRLLALENRSEKKSFGHIFNCYEPGRSGSDFHNKAGLMAQTCLGVDKTYFLMPSLAMQAL